MQDSSWKDRVTIDPGLRHGEPCMRGTRIPVAAIIGSLADGMSEDEIRKAYPQVTTARLPSSLLDEVAEERGASCKRHMVDVAVQGLVHSEHELGHTTSFLTRPGPVPIFV
jgi:uncharacterized protein (DUF433 family)